MNLLIPYVFLPGHNDPSFDEFTYGDAKSRGLKLKNELSSGDFVFFHTSRNRKKYITAYFVTDRVLDTNKACQERTIVDKYKNPHITEFLERGGPLHPHDVVLFGDPIKSRVFPTPLPFGKSLSEKLSLNIKFPPNRTEAQVIGSATRAWRELTYEDVEIILEAIRDSEKKIPREPKSRSTEEVSEVLEKDIEGYIADNPDLIDNNLSLLSRQEDIASGRADLIFEDQSGDLVLVEVKLGRIGQKAARQLKRYLHDLRRASNRNVRGIIIGSGVMPAYEADLSKQKDIDIYVYGWQLKIRPWQWK